MGDPLFGTRVNLSRVQTRRAAQGIADVTKQKAGVRGSGVSKEKKLKRKAGNSPAISSCFLLFADP
jgi:hypothetical protein